MKMLAVLIMALWVAAIGGWIANLNNFVTFAVTYSGDIGHVPVFIFVRVVGIFFVPLGCVLGFF